MHPFLTDQLATARLAEIHAEAKRRRTIREIAPRPGWRFWRRPGPRPRLVIELLPGSSRPARAPGNALRPVA